MKWKFRIILPLLLAFFVFGLAWHVLTLQSNIVKMAGIHNAKLYSDAITAFRTLYSSEVVKIAEKHGFEVTHAYLKEDNSIPLPATFSVLLGKKISEAGSSGTVKLYSPYPFPWRQDNGGLQDAFSQEAWNALTEKPAIPFYKFEGQNNQQTLRYAVADRMRESCINCHNEHQNTPKTGWKTGDVAGVLEINLPLASIVAASRSNIKGTIIIYSVLSLIVTIVIMMLIIKEKRYSLKLEQKVRDRTFEVEQQKVRAEKATLAKSEFLASMSHEIRTPMTSIIGMTELLSGSSLKKDEQEEALRILRGASENLLALINDVLDLSKIEAGHLELEEAEFELEDLICEAESFMGVAARGKGIELSRHIEPDVPVKFIGDASRLRQIIFNLVSNAVKFTEKGRVDINVRHKETKKDIAELVFYVKDTGIGIPEDKFDIIFEKFRQADSTTTRNFGGTGLGTAISKLLVEAMSGNIWVESELGKGSTFYFTVKLKISETAEVEKTIKKEMKEKIIAWKRPLKILIAEDSEDNLNLIVMHLKETPHIVDTAKNGKVAVEKFQAGNYDLVLMDMEMPVMDGYTATKEIRRWEIKEKKKPTPVVALTAHALKEHEQNSMDAGCTTHITKPFRKKKFLEAIYEYANKS